jgi:hypothetical protein
MPTRKTGSITGANLERATKAKKGGLTGSKRVTGETSTPASTLSDIPLTETPITSLGVPTPPSIGEKLKTLAEGTASAVEKGAATVNAFQGYMSRVGQAVQGTDNDHNPLSVTDGKLNSSEILKHASAEIDENIPQMDSAEAIKRNIVINRQRNHLGVLISNTRLKQDLATLDNEQKRLVGLLIDGKSLDINNQTKAVGYHRAITARDTELSRLEQDRELLTQQQIRTESAQAQTPLIQEQEQLKVAKLREEIQKQGHELQAITYEKERLKQETEAKFTAGF